MSNRLCLPSSEQSLDSLILPLSAGLWFCSVKCSCGPVVALSPIFLTCTLRVCINICSYESIFFASFFVFFFPFVTSFLVLLVHHKQFTKIKFYMKSCIIFCSITQKNCRMLESVRGDISTQTLWCSVLAAVVSLRFFMFCLGDFWLVVFSWEGGGGCLFVWAFCLLFCVGVFFFFSLPYSADYYCI